MGGALQVLQVNSFQINDVGIGVTRYFLGGYGKRGVEIFIEAITAEVWLCGRDLESHFEAVGADVPFGIEVGYCEILLEDAVRSS